MYFCSNCSINCLHENSEGSTNEIIWITTPHCFTKQTISREHVLLTNTAYLKVLFSAQGKYDLGGRIWTSFQMENKANYEREKPE